MQWLNHTQPTYFYLLLLLIYDLLEEVNNAVINSLSILESVEA